MYEAWYMRIEYFDKKTEQPIKNTDDELFVMNNEVYSDNFKTFESQPGVIGFHDCIVAMPNIGWRAI